MSDSSLTNIYESLKKTGFIDKMPDIPEVRDNLNTMVALHNIINEILHTQTYEQIKISLTNLEIFTNEQIQQIIENKKKYMLPFDIVYKNRELSLQKNKTLLLQQNGGYNFKSAKRYKVSKRNTHFNIKSMNRKKLSLGGNLSMEGMKEKARSMKEAASLKAEDIKKATIQKANEAKVKATEIKDQASVKAEDMKKVAMEKANEAKVKAGELKDQARVKADELKEKAGDLKDKSSDKLGELKEKAGELKDKASVKADELKEKAGELKDKASDKLGELKDQASVKADELKEKAGDLKDKASDKLGELKEKAGELKDQASVKVDELKEKAGDLKDKASDKLGELKDQSSVKVDELKEKAGELKDKAFDKLAELKDQASVKAGDLKDKASDKLGELKDQASVKADELKEKAGELKDKASDKLRNESKVTSDEINDTSVNREINTDQPEKFSLNFNTDEISFKIKSPEFLDKIKNFDFSIFMNEEISIIDWMFYPLWSIEKTPYIGVPFGLYLDFLSIVIAQTDIFYKMLGTFFETLKGPFLQMFMTIFTLGPLVTVGAFITPILSPVLAKMIDIYIHIVSNTANITSFFIQISRKNFGLAYIILCEILPLFEKIMNKLINLMIVINKLMSRGNQALDMYIYFLDNYAKTFLKMTSLNFSDITDKMNIFKAKASHIKEFSKKKLNQINEGNNVKLQELKASMNSNAE
jgi:hypothetical protein